MHICNWATINDNQDGKKEVCLTCKSTLITKKDPKTGRIDNKKYLKQHVADYAQPNGRTKKVFERYYGTASQDLRFK